LKSLNESLHKAYQGAYLKATWGLFKALSRSYLGITKGLNKVMGYLGDYLSYQGGYFKTT
jgi:hypothetical protein